MNIYRLVIKPIPQVKKPKPTLFYDYSRELKELERIARKVA